MKKKKWHLCGPLNKIHVNLNILKVISENVNDITRRKKIRQLTWNLVDTLYKLDQVIDPRLK